MITQLRRCHGYSLAEILVVLVIVGILGMVGVTMIGNRPGTAVRSVMDEIEGVLMNAQKTAVVTTRDVYLSTSGVWLDGSCILDGRALNPSAVTFPLTMPTDIKAGVDAKRYGSSSECFRSHYASDRDHMSAGVDCGNGWYAAALGSASDLKDVEPVKSETTFVSALGTRLFTGSDKYSIINGLTKRFEKGFSIVVVGLRSGTPVAGGPIGVIIVPENGSSVYKFYKPDGNAAWRRL